MDINVRARIIPPVAFKLCLIALGLGLTTLLSGITGNSPKAAAIATFNTSSLGLEAYRNPNTPLHVNVTNLVPSELTNPPSITRYLGAYDWYTIHYFTNCSGFFSSSTTNPSILTSTKVNVTCTRQVSGYTFALHDVIESNLLSSVKGVADSVSTAQYQTSTWSSLLYTGISNCFVAAFKLPWTFTGRRPWLTFWIWGNVVISTVMFLSSSAMVTNAVITAHHAKGIPGPNPWPGTFLGITWSTTTLMGTVCVLMWMQWRMQGTQRSCCREGTEICSDTRPIDEWKSEKTLVQGQKS